MSADSPRRLGRGLEALISTARQQREPPRDANSAAPSGESDGATLQAVPIAAIKPNRFQPRRSFTEPELRDLEASLKASGLLQPITVRELRTGHWELVAGERRLRAATRLGWTEISAIVRPFDDREMLTLALVENLQRADLNALEEADGYQRLIDEFGLTQQNVADAVGKDRSTISNLLRLLALPAAVRRMVEAGHLSAGHARALLAVKSERQLVELAHETVARNLSVREVEARARVAASSSSKPREAAPQTPSAIRQDPAVRRLEEQLRRRLQTDVSVDAKRGESGAIRIAFYSADDLERVTELIIGPQRSDFD